MDRPEFNSNVKHEGDHVDPRPDVQLETSTDKQTQHRTIEVHPLWWTCVTLIPFLAVHLLAFYGVFFVSPVHKVSSTTLLLCILGGQLGSIGITMGYHRLWSHRSFVATEPLRWFLALVALFGAQGSIKWWVLRHRVHHRWTDSEHDPYNAKRGLFFSHIGWLLRNPRYEKLRHVDRRDLDSDPVVVFQHRYFIPLVFFIGFLFPHVLSTYILKSNLHSRWDGFIWGGLVVKLWVWHSAFLTNSLAHYIGSQPYNLELTARSSLLVALLTLGEGNHNFHHLFAKDYRSGPSTLDWDPTKWTIYLLYKYTGLVKAIHVTPESEIEYARKRVIDFTKQNILSNDNSLGEFPSFQDLIRYDQAQGSKKEFLYTDTTTSSTL